MPSTPGLRRLLVIAAASAGVGMLGMSVQGMAAIDRDLAEAHQQQRQERDVKERLCPPRERESSSSPRRT